MISLDYHKPATMSAVMVAAVLAVSLAAPTISVLAIPAASIAAWRLLGAGSVYGVFAGGFRQLWRVRTDRAIFARSSLAGLVLSLHFLAWISAFDYTDLASAVLLLVIQPAFAALLGRWVFGEPLRPGMGWALLLAVAGLALIVFDDLTWSRRALIGDGLSVASSAAIAVFYVVARPLRDKVPFAGYMTATYGFAGTITLVVALVLASPLSGYGAREWGLLALLVVVPTGVGHALMNVALKYVRLFTINLAVVGEPICAIAIAAIWLGMPLTIVEGVGGAILAMSLFVGFRDERVPETQPA